MRKKTYIEQFPTGGAVDARHKKNRRWCNFDLYLYNIVTRDAMDASQLKEYNIMRRGYLK